MTGRRTWSTEMEGRLREMYATHSGPEIAAEFGMELKQIYYKAQKLGLRKSKEWIAERARRAMDDPNHGANRSRFQKGLQPWNKGTHYTAGGRSAETRFQKGHRGGKAALLYQPIGTERVSKDGYLERKIHDGLPLQRRWRAVHLLVWEAANGPLPAGHAVCFRDGNKRNIAIDNLELVPRAELMRRNTVHNLPKEVARNVQLLGALRRQINQRTKGHDDEKHG